MITVILDGRAEMRLLDQYRAVRARTLELAEPLSPEDQVVQSMPDASPTKWHLAHTTWFFETFVLKPHAPGDRPFDPTFEFLFNSYYEGVGPRPDRARRGAALARSLDEVQTYRRHVDQAIGRLLEPGTVATRSPRSPRRSRLACTTNSSTRSCCSPTSSTRSASIRSIPPTRARRAASRRRRRATARSGGLRRRLSL